MSRVRNCRVSVIITTYYRNSGLRRALDAVLSQSHEEVEIIVVDDSGETYAKRVIEKYRDIQYLHHEVNRGQIAAWETGLEAASGEFVQLHDDDDILSPEKFAQQLEVFSQNPKVGVVYSGVRHPNGAEFLPKPHVRGNVLEAALTVNKGGNEIYPCYTTSMLIRKTELERIVPIKRWPAGTDTALVIELASQTHFDSVDEIHVGRNPGEEKSVSTVAFQWEQRRKQLHYYDDRFDDTKTSLKTRSLANVSYLLGHKRLEENVWSWQAIKEFLRAIHYSRSIDLVFIGSLFLSIFGRPGQQFGRFIAKRVCFDNI